MTLNKINEHKASAPDIKAVIFDLGGVLFSHGKLVAIEKLFKDHGCDRKIVSGILKSPKSTDLRRGLITDDDFWNWAQEHLPTEYSARLIKKIYYDGYILDKDIFNLVKQLKGKYKLITFSGNIKSRIDYLEQKYHFRKYFDLEIYSFDYHLSKGQKEFVEVLIKKSGNKPHEMLYIDNNEKAVKPARELGINIIIYKAGKIYNLKKELNNFGIHL